MITENRKVWFKNVAVNVDAEKQTSKDIIEASDLDWKVEKRKVFTHMHGDTNEIPGKFAVVREDNHKPLGIVGNVYRPLQNTEAFSYFDAIVGTKEAKYISAGSFGDGAKVWMVAKLGGELKVSHDDTLEKYVILTNSHDGSSAVNIQLLALRLICQNGMLGFKSKGIHKVRHTLSMGLSISKVRESLGILNNQFNLIEKLSKKMINTKFTNTQMVPYLQSIGLIPNPETTDKVSTRTDNIINAVTYNYQNGLGAVPGTLWGAYNAVTEFLDWQSVGNEKKTKSNLFGHGANVKIKALEYAKEA